MSGVADNSWSDLIPSYEEMSHDENAAVDAGTEELAEPEAVDKKDQVVKDSMDLHKRWRRVRKKLRQISELEIAQKQGTDLDDDQLEKLSKKLSLEAEKRELEKVVNVDKCSAMPAAEPQAEETVQHVQDLIAKSLESGTELETRAPEVALSHPDSDIHSDTQGGAQSKGGRGHRWSSLRSS